MATNQNIIGTLDSLNIALAETVQKLSRVRTVGGAKKLQKQFNEITASIKKMQDSLQTTETDKNMKKLTDSVTKSQRIIEKEIRRGSKQRSQIEQQYIKETEKREDQSFKRRIDRLSHFSTRALDFLKLQLLWYPMKALSFKLLAIPGDVIKSTAEYGDALRQVSSVAQLIPSQLEVLDKEIQQTAATTKYNLTEISVAVKQLAQAGFRGDELKEAIKPIALLSTATASSMEETTSLVSTVIRAYGKNATQIAQITDTLAAAVTKSRLTISDLSDAFNYVASASAQAGVSFEDTTSLLAILANSGMKMTTAATGLRMSFLKMIAPTKQASKELKKFGLTDEDIDLTKHSINEVLKTIESLPIDSVIRIFSARSASAILAIMNVGEGARLAMRKALDAQGLAATMAKEQLLGLKQSWKNLLDVTAIFETTLGRTFSDDLAIKIRTVRNLLQEWTTEGNIFITTISSIVKHLGAIGLAIAAISVNISNPGVPVSSPPVCVFSSSSSSPKIIFEKYLIISSGPALGSKSFKSLRLIPIMRPLL